MSRISDLAGFTTALSTTEDLSVGIITAVTFSGNGSGLTGVASTDNIQTATEATFLSGVKISGVTTASGGVVGNVTGNATGLSGTPNITVGAINASSGTVSGNLSIGGTLTYQDVTNMDVLGIGTFQQGIQVLANGLDITGFSTFKTGVSVTGVVTATSFSGSATGLTGTPSVTVNTVTSAHINNTGVTSSSSFVGDITGDLTGDISANTTVSGVATATRFGGFDSLISAESSATTTYLVTVASKTSNHRYNGSGSSSGYFLDGRESPIVKLTPGKTYKFDQGDSSNSSHPLLFYLESDKTTLYSEGVTTNGTPGSAGAYTQIVVGDTTPAVLHYQCSSHSLMGNAVTNDSSVVNSNYDSRFGGFLKESVTVTAGKLSDNTNIDLENGNVFLFTTTETTTSTPNLRYNGSTALNAKMAIGETVAVTIVTTAAAAAYSAQLTIDGSAVTENWTGGSAPSEGGSSGVDIYSYMVMKTADATFTVIGSLQKTS